MAEGEFTLRSKEDEIKQAKFNLFNLNEIVTTSYRKVRFWEKKSDKKLTSYEPISIKKEEHHKELSRVFVQSEFIPEKTSQQAISATQEGHLIMWDISLVLEETANLQQRKEVKSINLLSSFNKLNDKKTTISNLLIYDKLIVIGTSSGSVRFYDFRFRIVCWFENLGLAEITSISFSKKKFNFDSFWKKLDKSFKEQNNTEYNFSYTDFIVSDAHAKVHFIKCSLFSEIESSKRKADLILEGFNKPIIAMVQHPIQKYLVFSCFNGNVFFWTLESPLLTLIKDYKEEDGYISCLAFSPCGNFLVAGTSKGNILIKKENQKFFGSASLLVSQKKKKVSCKKIEFSPDGKHFAIMDDRRCVSLFKLVDNYGELSQNKNFVFVGKLMSHTAPITDIKFAYKKTVQNKKRRRNSIKIKNSGFKQSTTQENSDIFTKVQGKEEVLIEKNQNIHVDVDVNVKQELFLYSIGKDCFLTEYNIEQSKDCLQVESFQRIENQYEPLSLLFIKNETEETQLIISNSGYKLKVWENSIPLNNHSDYFKCIKTQLGPVYGYPINKMQKISLQTKDQQTEDYVIYSTESKVIGLIKLPLNGNPNKWMGLVAHSNEINCFLSDSSQNKVFTAGNEDLNLCIWDIDVDKVQNNPLFKRELTDPLEIVPQFFEGGRKGKIFSDLENFFYYSQIRRKEENITKAHKLDGKIPLQEIPNLITALGFYSTLLEITNIQNEVLKQKQSQNTNLKLGEFIKLFINHKPVYGLEYKQLQKAFKSMSGGNEKIKRELFIEILTKSGELFLKEDCENYLRVLTGLNDLEEMLPDEFDLNKLLFDILGFENIN